MISNESLIGPGPPQTERARLVRRHEVLLLERGPWDAIWNEIHEMVRPGRWRKNIHSTSRETDLHAFRKIINPKSIYSNRVLVAGFMSGYTNPARPWFQLTLKNADISLFPGAGAWLHYVEEQMREILLKSNFYDQVMLFYDDLGAMATAVILMEEDDETLIRFSVVPPGTYCLATSYKGEVEVLFRKVMMTVEQVIDRFDPKNVSETVKHQADSGQIDNWVDILHVIEPNKNHVVGSNRSENRPWLSTWLELNAPQTHDALLLQTGHYSKPFATTRWMVTGENIYGTDCPGFMSLPHSKSLQHVEKRTATLKDQISQPSLNVPGSLRGKKVSIIPGATNYIPDMMQGQKIEPIYMPHPQSINELREDIQRFEKNIEQAYFVDMWLHLTQMLEGRREMTAREVDERHHEKMMMLGPVIQRSGGEFLKVVIDRVYDIMERNGEIPHPPPSLEGMELDIEFISILAKAQKAVGFTAMQELAITIQGLGTSINPEAFDKLMVDEYIDQAADMLGVPPGIIANKEHVRTVREQRAQQQQQMMEMQQAQEAAKAGKDLSQAKLDDDNALNRILAGIGNLGAGRMPTGE